ncbi:MAG: DedA family protein [Actinomycetota bacterium]
MLGVTIFALLLVAGLTDGGGTIQAGENPATSYLTEFLFVAGDGIFPVLPGETTINTAAVLASEGNLSLPLVILAGALGAIAGDSIVYTVGRRGHGWARQRIARVADEDRMKRVERLFGRRGPIIVALGRFCPGLRLVTSFTAGMTQMPVRRYLPPLALGATVWSTYCSFLGYWAGQTFDGKIWVSIAVSTVASAALLGSVGYLERRSRRQQEGTAPTT